ncbi:hypothetical protein VTK26DRAFT_8880 [Humicola hyalothermophila]
MKGCCVDTVDGPSMATDAHHHLRYRVGGACHFWKAWVWFLRIFWHSRSKNPRLGAGFEVFRRPPQTFRGDQTLVHCRGEHCGGDPRATSSARRVGASYQKGKFHQSKRRSDGVAVRSVGSFGGSPGSLFTLTTGGGCWAWSPSNVVARWIAKRCRRSETGRVLPWPWDPGGRKLLYLSGSQVPQVSSVRGDPSFCGYSC